jgi:putative sterol carrier protein
MAEIFTQEWAEAWCQAINGNAAYRKAAKNWEGPVGLVMRADATRGIPEPRAVVADLWHGECRGAAAKAGGDASDAAYVIAADVSVWKNVLEGETDPIVGLMGGKLKLEKGPLFKLLPYAKAAKEMVASAQSVETEFPG